MNRTISARRQELDEQGFTILEDLVEPALLERLVRTVDDLESALDARPLDDRYRGQATIKIYDLVGRDEIFLELLGYSALGELLEHVLGEGFLLGTTSTLDRLPGEIDQPLHTDDMSYSAILGRPHPAVSCNTIWALTDFTSENGATRVIPGSHRWVETPGNSMAEVVEFSDRHGLAGGAVVAEMRAGSVLLTHGSVWHGGGANRTDRRRLGIGLNMHAGWVRPSSNNMFSLPLSTVRRLPTAIADMLGFGVYQGLVGNIAGRPPLDALAGLEFPGLYADGA